MSHRSSSHSGRSHQARPEYMDNHSSDGQAPTDHPGLPLNSYTPYNPAAPPGSHQSSSSYSPGHLFPPSGASSQGGHSGSSAFNQHVHQNNPFPMVGTQPFGQHHGASHSSQSSHSQPSYPGGSSGYEGGSSGNAPSGSSHSMYGTDGQYPQSNRHSGQSSIWGLPGHQHSASAGSDSTMYGRDGQNYGQGPPGSDSSSQFARHGQNGSYAQGHPGSDYSSQFARHGQNGAYGHSDPYGQDGQDGQYDQDGVEYQGAGGPHGHGTFYDDGSGHSGQQGYGHGNGGGG
jgi:hypothetical protein